MGMLGMLFTALLIGLLVLWQMRKPAPASRPAEPVKEAAAAAQVDASNYQNLLKGVKTKVEASSKSDAARVHDVQQTQDAP